MRYFYNPKNNNKYQTSSNAVIEMFIRIGYIEITQSEFEEMEDIF